MENTYTRLCPCCQQVIDGQVDNPNLRKGAKSGAKFLAKQGIKAVAGESIASTTAVVGATIGSVVPVVGNFIGYVAGYTIGHVAQEIALESAYNAVENKYAARVYSYYCPSCNLSWTSNDTNDRTIVINNLLRYYDATKRSYPQKPKDWLEEDSFRYKLSYVCPLCLIISPIYLRVSIYFNWINDIGDTTEIIVNGIFAVFTLIIWIINLIYYMEWKADMKAYYSQMEEVNNYNKKLHDDVLNRLNTTIRKCKGRLGMELSALPGVQFVDLPTDYKTKSKLGSRIKGAFEKIWHTMFKSKTRGTVSIALFAILIGSLSYYLHESNDPDNVVASELQNNLLKDDWFDGVINLSSAVRIIGWPSVICQGDTIYSYEPGPEVFDYDPFDGIKIKVVGKNKYRLSCICPIHKDKYVDKRIIETALSPDSNLYVTYVFEENDTLPISKKLQNCNWEHTEFGFSIPTFMQEGRCDYFLYHTCYWVCHDVCVSHISNVESYSIKYVRDLKISEVADIKQLKSLNESNIYTGKTTDGREIYMKIHKQNSSDLSDILVLAYPSSKRNGLLPFKTLIDNW